MIQLLFQVACHKIAKIHWNCFCCMALIVVLFSAHLFEEVDESVTMVTEKFRPVSTLGEMLVGQGGVAQFQDDGRWYRATVVTIDGDSAEVSYCLATGSHANEVIYSLFFFLPGVFCRFR